MIDHYLFLLKKFLGNLVMPLPLTLLLLIWALISLLRRKTRWFGIVLVAVATALLFISSYAPLSQKFIADFEERIPSYEQTGPSADYIVVLGSWHQSSGKQPVTSELSPTAVVRLAEGIRVYRLNPGSKLIFTGYAGNPSEPVSYPEKIRQLAIEMGIPQEDILVISGPRDTREEAGMISRMFPAARLVLVTSAIHMPRALGLFNGAGLDPQPAPTEHLTKPVKSWWVFPSGKTLFNSEYWAHERLGLLWARLMGQVKDDPAND